MNLAQRLRSLHPDSFAELDEAALDSLLRQRLDAARARFEKVRLDDGAFVAHLARHLPRDLAALKSLDVDGLYLAAACGLGDRAALADLDSRILSKVPGWVARMAGISADDVQQELRQKLLMPPAHILDYGGRGVLERWVRVAANRCAIDLQRMKKPEISDELDHLWDGPDPELDLAKLRDQKAVRAALHDALRGLQARERSLLRLHYVEGVSLDKLATLERVHRATVARWLSSARETVVERVRALINERLRLTDLEGESLLRFVRSRLDLSLRRVLDAPTTPPG
jgi:RNA polymerase sigma-70 factor (ECF subfamily)